MNMKICHLRPSSSELIIYNAQHNIKFKSKYIIIHYCYYYWQITKIGISIKPNTHSHTTLLRRNDWEGHSEHGLASLFLCGSPHAPWNNSWIRAWSWLTIVDNTGLCSQCRLLTRVLIQVLSILQGYACIIHLIHSSHHG